MTHKLSDVSSAYGAPMGRREKNQDCNGKVSLRRVPINSGGYDSGGAYWGLGGPLFWARDEEGTLEWFFRARDREAAKAHVLSQWPEAKFFR